ncbi:uncharacterized protein LOC131693829 [Topomyia yanbarensis]|uniref:uncharacterized protein LOC131693829 n=1 Tax=Topomyia yanbarensis TaxID=2498891 RepID=UPI00273C8D80|nr:uncharacterized protein LOC131693829 [Topomyia yanbarensis]
MIKVVLIFLYISKRHPVVVLFNFFRNWQLSPIHSNLFYVQMLKMSGDMCTCKACNEGLMQEQFQLDKVTVVSSRRKRFREFVNTLPVIATIRLDEMPIDGGGALKIHSSATGPSHCTIDCPICFEPIWRKDPVSTICGHLFCRACISRELRLRKDCPICKRVLTPDSVHSIFFL